MMSNQGRMLMQSIYNPVLGVNSSQDIQAHDSRGASGRAGDESHAGLLIQSVAQGDTRGPSQRGEPATPDTAAKVGSAGLSPVELQVDDAAAVVVD